MTELVLHTKTRESIDRYLKKPSHALLLSGSIGSGKVYLARSVASKLLNCEVDSLANQAYFLQIEPSNNTISINQIRELQKFLSLKVPGTSQIRRVILIADAHYMTTEAQNALLKSLEEPPKDTVLILTAESTKQLLTTVVSRSQEIQLINVGKAQLEATFSDLLNDTDQNKRSKLISIANGRPGLLHALLTDEDHPLVKQIEASKEFLSMLAFDRLILVQGMKEKEDVTHFLQALLLVCEAAQRSSIESNKVSDAKNWHKRTKRVYEACEQLSKNAQTKLLLTDLAINL